jgi:hypothetical protein
MLTTDGVSDMTFFCVLEKILGPLRDHVNSKISLMKSDNTRIEDSVNLAYKTDGERITNIQSQ